MDLVRALILCGCFIAVGTQHVIISDNLYDTNICTPVKYNYGYIPPSAPYNFIVKYRETSFDKYWSELVEIYFDMENQRYKIAKTENGYKSIQIYDFAEEVKIVYDEQNLDGFTTKYQCDIKDLSDDWSVNKGFDLLKYGLIDYKQNIEETVRSIPTIQFTACVYNPSDDSTTNITYSWTMDKIYTNAFTSQSPYRVKIHSSVQDFTNPYNETTVRDIFWFENSPKFKDTDFQVPINATCTSYRSNTVNLDLETIPSYHVRQEVATQYTINNIIHQNISDLSIWYSQKKQIKREDYFTTNCTSGAGKLYCNQLVSVVHDYKYKTSYILGRTSDRCQTMPLSYFKNADVDTRFFSDFNQKYRLSNYRWSEKMKETYRDMPLNVYMSNSVYETVQNRYSQTNMEMSYLQKSWEDATYDGLKTRMPVRMRKRIQFTDGKQPTELSIVSNNYMINEEEQSSDYFNIQRCSLGSASTYIKFKLNVTNKDEIYPVDEGTLFTIKDQFVNPISEAIGIRFYRIEKFWNYFTGTVYNIRMKIYENIPLDGGPKRVSMTDAVTKLKNLISNEKLQFKIVLPNNRIQSLSALTGSLITN